MAGKLVGRAGELQRAAILIDDLSSGRGHVLLIRGEPGIGKTACSVRSPVPRPHRGARLAVGAAEEFEQGLPFAAMTACLAVIAGIRDLALNLA